MKNIRLINNKIEFLTIFLLLFFAIFTHFYKLNDYFNLTGDPGRDAVTVYDIIVNKKLTLLGPKTSTGGFYYSPLYFYLLVPVFVLTRLDPIAAPILTATVGIITVFSLYFIARELFGKKTAFLASFLYTVSPFVLTQARRGWNPSLLPIFSLLCFYFFFKFLKEKRNHYLLWWGVCFGAGLQFHFALIFSLPVYLILFLAKGRKVKSAFVWLILALLAITVFFLPIFIFELRHNFITTKSFFDFARFGVEKGRSYHQGMSISYYLTLIYQSLTSLIFTESDSYLLLLSIVIPFFPIIYINRNKITKHNALVYSLVVFLGSLLVLGFYHGPVHPYYWVFIQPLPFLLVGFYLGSLLDKKWPFKVFALTLFGVIFYQSLFNLRSRIVPKRTIKQEKEAAKIITDDAKSTNDKKINIVMISPIDAAHSAFEYRYLVKYYGGKVLPAEDYKNAEKLYIVAEQEIDNPLKQPIMEIKDFGPTQTEKEWKTLIGYTIYRLGK